MNDILIHSRAILPEIILAAGTLTLLTASFFKFSKVRGFFLILSLAIYSISILFLLAGEKYFGDFFSNSIRIDSTSDILRLLILLTGFITVILTEYSNELKNSPRLEMNLLIMGSVLGGLFMVISSNMIMLYLSVEFISLLTYLLTGLTYRKEKSLEAAVKYSIYGGFSSGIMLFGLSFLYGLTGSIDFTTLSSEIVHGPASSRIMLLAGTAFFLSGMGYKLAMVPFHAWCPDVYEGAATPFTYFFIVPRIAGFGILIVLFKTAFLQHISSGYVYESIAVISAVTMTLGNFSALNQTGIKRLLSYSSIAHGGYALALFSIMGSGVDQAIMYYMFAYMLMTGGTFIIFQMLSENGEGDLTLFQGLAFRGRNGAFLAASMAGFAFSLIGIPPFTGFMGKYLIFSHLIEDGRYWLAIIMGINTVLSIYYYMKFLHLSYFTKNENTRRISIPIPITLILVLISALNIIAGIFPGLVLDLI